jgi:hypothetical protein
MTELNSITQREAASDNNMSSDMLANAKRLRLQYPELDRVASDMEVMAMLFALLLKRMEQINRTSDMRGLIAAVSREESR